MRGRAKELVQKRTEQERWLVRRDAAGSTSLRVHTCSAGEAVRFCSTRWAVQISREHCRRRVHPQPTGLRRLGIQ
ncbi:hypothetical protein GUJ93_ZPchr0001g31805 [Zizania palustris]|uniref:Uncharacterized protein n=1 Tax=Zizania palustris TaxID=103762 RepID=A0A8J5S0G7_ZIZPA|nr:hypothetical protein GUJ93_ZPchr0001g31805 [Zizania palustris]